MPFLGSKGYSSNLTSPQKPPADPIVITPISSESRFKRYFAVKKSDLRYYTPCIVDSSSLVQSTSIRPLLIDLSKIKAKLAANPIPLSAPKVVPVATTTCLPSTVSILGLIGSFKKSC